MQIRHNITNFKKPAYIYYRQKDDSYFLKIKGQEINLLDEDIFDKVDAIYPNQMRYAMMTYNIISSLRENKPNEDELQKYNQAFGTKFKTK